MEAVNAATVTTINDHGSLGEANAKMYIWFGDPAQNLWTFDEAGYPEPLLIDPPDEIPPGNQDVTVTVTANGSPVEGVNVTLTDGVDNYSKAQTFHAEGTTNASGEATINIDAPASGTVYVGAFLQDYYYDTAEVIIGTGVAESPSQTPVLSLDRPSPNPVIQNTSIGFSVPGSGNVELSVYDVSGRMVETVYSGTVQSGNHSVEWAPGADIGSGVYFLRLSTESGTLTQQAMVIR